MAQHIKATDFKKLKETLAPMSWKERIDHIWTYYKLIILCVVFVLILLVDLIAGMVGDKNEVLFRGNITNLILSQQGNSFLTEEYSQVLGGTPGQKQVELVQATTTGMDSATTNEMGVDGGVQVASMIGAGILDYVITDEVGLEYLMKQNSFRSLEDVLTQDQMTRHHDDLIYYTEAETQETYPVAIEITQIPFIRDCLDPDRPVYLAFPWNAPRAAQLSSFLEYLLSWDTEA